MNYFYGAKKMPRKRILVLTTFACCCCFVVVSFFKVCFSLVKLMLFILNGWRILWILFSLRIMSLSGSPIVNHGPISSDAEVLIPLRNGQVMRHHKLLDKYTIIFTTKAMMLSSRQ